MSNFNIAVDYAVTTLKTASTFAYSDQFFSVFSQRECKKLIKVLDKRNVAVYPDGKQGAYLFKKNDPRLHTQIVDGVKVGAWCDTDKGQVMILPIGIAI